MENLCATPQHEWDSAKVKVFCAITNCSVFGSFFFVETNVTGCTYLDMLSKWLLHQLEEKVPEFILQQDGSPPHWNGHVHDHLNDHFPQRWIGRAGPNDVPLIFWLRRSPDLTPCDFFFWGYVKDKLFVPSLPQDI
jgi:hypothetical protein